MEGVELNPSADHMSQSLVIDDDDTTMRGSMTQLVASKEVFEVMGPLG